MSYEEKFREFIRLCEAAKANGVEEVIVGEPGALGDDYAELMESLCRIADAGLKLVIVASD